MPSLFWPHWIHAKYLEIDNLIAVILAPVDSAGQNRKKIEDL